MDAAGQRRDQRSEIGPVAGDCELVLVAAATAAPRPARASPSPRRSGPRSRRRSRRPRNGSSSGSTCSGGLEPARDERDGRHRCGHPGRADPVDRRRGDRDQPVEPRPERAPGGTRTTALGGPGRCSRRRTRRSAGAGREPVQRQDLEQERVDRLLLHPDRVRADVSELPRQPDDPLAPRAGGHAPHLDPRPSAGLGRPVRRVHARQLRRRRREHHRLARRTAPTISSSASQWIG